MAQLWVEHSISSTFVMFIKRSQMVENGHQSRFQKIKQAQH